MDPFTALTDAITCGDIADVRRKVGEMRDVNFVPEDHGYGVLHWAALCHFAEAVQALLEAGADVELLDVYGNAPLHYAAFDRSEDDETIRLLRAAGADPAGAANRHELAFEGLSVVAVHDDDGVVLSETADGKLTGFWRPWIETYSPTQPDDFEHVFDGLPHALTDGAIFTWGIARLPTSSRGEPVQVSVYRVAELDRPFPTPHDREYTERGYDVLGNVTRLPVTKIEEDVGMGRVADPETAMLLYAILTTLSDATPD